MNNGNVNPRRRMFMGKPGVYVRKEYNLWTEILIPVFQAIVCILILFLDVIFLGSWAFILPAKADWYLGIFIQAIVLPIVIFLSSGLISLMICKIARSDFITEIGLTKLWEYRWEPWLWGKQIALVMFIFPIHIIWWDIWWKACMRYPDPTFTLSVPHVEQGSGFVVLGIFIVVIGITGFLLHPGKYPLGLTTFGGFMVTVAQWLSPVIITTEPTSPLILYCIWAAWTFAFVIGTGTLFPRLYLRELLEYSDFGTQRAPAPLEGPLSPENRSGRGGQEGY